MSLYFVIINLYIIEKVICLNSNDLKVIDNIKNLGIDMINEAGSGHPGIVLGAATIMYTLFSKHLNINPKDDRWLSRDRFVMSAGHGSALFYATLFMAGYDLTIDDLKKFRRLNSKTPGHPEYGITPGVEVSTGPLGQGLASAVGMAMAERYLATKYNSKKDNIFDYFTYVLCGDGDLMEGISYEATSLAGNLKLGKLIVLYDSNNISLDGTTKNTFTENVLDRFAALGWHTQLVKKGDDVNAIDKAINKAKGIVDKPSIIEIKTIIGKGSINAGTNKVHGAPLSKEDIEQLKQKFGIRNIPFAASKDASDLFRKSINDRCLKKYEEWNKLFADFFANANENIKAEFKMLVNKNYNVNIQDIAEQFNSDLNESTRDTNGKVMNIIADKITNFIGGSADLASSTRIYLNEYKDFSPLNYDGKNIWFGVREHAMGAILNGLAVSGLKVFGSTFLSFADYMKPAIRLAALMNLPVTYVFTHDAINIGSDGPTHQPIEQLAMLRSIPNFNVYRPADAKEVVGCWQAILKHNKPSAIVLSRNELQLNEGTNVEEVEKGAYIVKREKQRLGGIIIATGSEVQTAIKASEQLYKKGIDARVISMPSMELFLKQSKEYQDMLFPFGIKKVLLEASSSYGLDRFVYNEKYLISVNDFGMSGTKDEVLDNYDFSYEKILKRLEDLLR
jgi:transketolase